MNCQTPPPPSRAHVVTLLCVALLLSTVVALTRSVAAAGESNFAWQEVETTFRWAAETGVSRYRLQVSLDPRFTNIIYDGAVSGLEQKVPLAPGTYYWRYAAAPKETGRFSPPIKIEVPASASAPVTSTAPTSAVRTTPTPIARATPSPMTRPTPNPTMHPTTRPTTRPTPNSVTRATPTPSPFAPAVVTPKILRPPANVGWETAMGAVDRVVAARLRAGQSSDFVAVNADGTVFAVEGATGAALWTTRYVPGRQAAGAASNATGPVFTPIPVRSATADVSNVLVAFDGGVRVLEGETGSELWRAVLKGRALGGCPVELVKGDAVTQMIAVTTDEQQLYFLNPSDKTFVAQTKLDNDVIGLPIPFQNGAERGVALTLKGGQVEARGTDGKRLRGVKFDVPFITPPLVIAGPGGTLVVVGSEHGLLYLDGTFKPLGRITTEGESPRGRLAAADLNGDGVLEIVCVTNHDRVIVVSGEGKIIWTGGGARGAYTPAFADLDGDGVLDVLAADSATFARGYSGRDGALIWQAGDEANSTTSATTATTDDPSRPLRTLVVASGGANASPLIVGGDRSRSALRAVGLPAGAVRASAK